MHPDEQAAQAAKDVSGHVKASHIRNVVQANRIEHMAVNGSWLPEWPIQIGVLPPPAAARQEREVDSILENTFDSGVLVLSGMGGVGKSQAAAVYARRKWNTRELDLLVWVNAATRDAVITALGQAAVEICGARPHDADTSAVQFVSWLARPACRWLLVFDDLTDPAHLDGLWPTLGFHGRVLITTRRRDAALDGEGRQRFEVNAFSDQQALDYLCERFGRRTDVLEGGAELAGDLGRLPLALAQAAAYIQDQPGLSCTGYRALLADQTIRLSELQPDSPPDGYGQTVAAAWSLSIDHADQLTPAGIIRPLLQLASLLDPNGIPAKLFTTRAVLGHLDDASARTVERALARLHQVGLVDYSGERVRIHAIIQRAVADDINGSELECIAVVAGNGLLEMWPEIERDLDEIGMLRSNVRYLRRRADRVLLRHRIHPVIFRMGVSLGFQGQVAEAVDYFRELHEASCDSFGPDNPQTRSALELLAAWKGEAGDIQFALDTYAESYTILESKLGPLDRETIFARNQYGFWLIRAGDFSRANAEFESMLPAVEQACGVDDPLTFVVRHNIATCRGETGDVKGAIAAFTQLAEDRNRVLGPDDWNTIATRASLAHWRGEAGDAAGAAAAFKEVLDDCLRVLASDDPNILGVRADLALWRGKAGDAAGAATSLKELLDDCLRVLGPVHPDTLEARRSAAVWRGEAGRPEEAADELEELAPLVMRMLGSRHPTTMSIIADLASWQGRSGRPADAVATLEPLLGEYIEAYGVDDARVLTTRANLAGWRGRAGDTAGAASAFGDILVDRVRVLGPDHPHTLTTRQNLADWQGATGDITGAMEALARLLVDRVRVLGPDHPHTLTTRHSLARWIGRTGDLDGAVAALEGLLVDRVRLLGPDHPHTLATKANLAYWRGMAKDQQRAIELLGEVLVDRSRIFGNNHPLTIRTRKHLDFWITKHSGPPEPTT